MQIIALNPKNARKFSSDVIRRFEKRGIKVKVNRDDMSVEFECDDPYLEMKCISVIKSIAEGGVNPNIAFKLFSDLYVLKMVDLGEILKSKDVRRVMGRIIGTNGKMKKFMEEITETDINMFEDKIIIIGTIEGVELTSKAVNALIRGAPHKKVYRLLEAGRRGIKESKMRLWKGEMDV